MPLWRRSGAGLGRSLASLLPLLLALLVAAGPTAAESSPPGILGEELTFAAAPLQPEPSRLLRDRALARGGQPTWVRYAAWPPPARGHPRIAIVLDDLGLNAAATMGALDLPAPTTLSFLPYGRSLDAWAFLARARGHEVLLHMPMQPIGPERPGPNALRVDLSDAELQRRLKANLDSFTGYVGINNHMGSRFTASAASMAKIVAPLRRRGLIFLDSRTIGASRAAAVTREAGVPTLERDVFLDDVIDRAQIARQLDEVEAIARRHGQAIAIGHPHAATLAELRAWIPSLAEKGLVLVPLTALLAPAGTFAFQQAARRP